MRVTILGTGYVGLTTGACLAHLGHQVICLDTDADKIAMLKEGRSPIYEPELDRFLKTDRLSFTTDVAEAIPGAEVIFIAVGTPPLADGNPDLRFLRAASESIGKLLESNFVVVVNKSTVPIGSGNWVESLIRTAHEKAHGRKPDGQFAVASNPEFLREGSAVADSLYPDRVVVGADSSRALNVLKELYKPVLEQTFEEPVAPTRPLGLKTVPLVATDLASAELIKYAANAFLALKISFINEIGNLAERVGADVREVARGIGLDSRIGSKFLQSGIGWGGSCFGKDTAALISTAVEYGLSMPIVAAARDINQRQRIRVTEKLLAELKILKGRTIALLGLSFKPDTDDLREAPSLDIARRLLHHGCIVRAHDPVSMPRFQQEHGDIEITLSPTVLAAVEDADAIVLVTEWPEYEAMDWTEIKSRVRTPLVLDGRSFLNPVKLTQAGFRVITIP